MRAFLGVKIIYIRSIYIIKRLLRVRAYISVIVAFMRRITVIPQSERSSVVGKDNGGKLADIIRYHLQLILLLNKMMLV